MNILRFGDARDHFKDAPKLGSYQENAHMGLL